MNASLSILTGGRAATRLLLTEVVTVSSFCVPEPHGGGNTLVVPVFVCLPH